MTIAKSLDGYIHFMINIDQINFTLISLLLLQQDICNGAGLLLILIIGKHRII